MSIKATGISFTTESEEMKKKIITLVNREVDSFAQRTKTAATKAMLHIGRQAVTDWYSASGLNSGVEVASALRTESNFVRNQGGDKVIRVTSYFDSSVLDGMSSYFKSAERWCYKHSEINCDYTPGTYVFLLRWNTGALNLPEESNVSDWINDNYQVSPYGALQNYFSMCVLAKIGSLTTTLTRGRNRKMGAGTESANRTGLSNLSHRK